MVIAAGVPSNRVHGLQPGIPFHALGLTVHAVPARHGIHVADAYSFGRELSDGAVRFLGYVIESDGVSVYHAGDTVDYDELADRLRSYRVGVALLPINGRNSERESLDIVGNLEPEEAADLLRRASIPVVLPMHYDMFARNLGRPDRLVGELMSDSTKTVIVPAIGRPFVLGI
jgi:L-ascorbate metabolism protein UlaG (beta-lactamase superfamily)